MFCSYHVFSRAGGKQSCCHSFWDFHTSVSKTVVFASVKWWSRGKSTYKLSALSKTTPVFRHRKPAKKHTPSFLEVKTKPSVTTESLKSSFVWSQAIYAHRSKWPRILVTTEPTGTQFKSTSNFLCKIFSWKEVCELFLLMWRILSLLRICQHPCPERWPMSFIYLEVNKLRAHLSESLQTNMLKDGTKEAAARPAALPSPCPSPPATARVRFLKCKVLTPTWKSYSKLKVRYTVEWTVWFTFLGYMLWCRSQALLFLLQDCCSTECRIKTEKVNVCIATFYLLALSYTKWMSFLCSNTYMNFFSSDLPKAITFWCLSKGTCMISCFSSHFSLGKSSSDITEVISHWGAQD